MQHTPYMEPPQGQTIEMIEPGRLTFSGPVRKRPALESLLTKNGFRLEQPHALPDGTLPHPGHGLPSYTDPLAAAKAGAPNSGHTPGTPHPTSLHFAIQPGDHKKTGTCKEKDCVHVGQTEMRPNPLTEHHGKPYEHDPRVTFVTCHWFRDDQIHQARFIAEGCGWTLRSVTAQGRCLIQDEPEHPSIVALRQELDVIREMVGLPPRMAGAAANSPAYAMQNGSHPAQLFRQATSLAYNQAGGIINPGDYAVTQNGTPNMTVNIAGGLPGGQILLPRTGTSYAALYYGYNDASVNLTGFTAPSSNSWIATVFAQAEDYAYGDATTVFQLGFLTGTSSATPVAPTLAASETSLANITISSTTTSITTSLITSTRSQARLNLPLGFPAVRSSSATVAAWENTISTATGQTYTLPASPQNGCTNTLTAQSGAATLAANSGQTINHYATTGLAGITIPQGMSVQVQYLSGVWYVIDGGFVPGMILGSTTYNPTTGASQAVSTSALTGVNANLACAFVVPPDGSVLERWSCWSFTSLTDGLEIGLVNSSGGTTQVGQARLGGAQPPTAAASGGQVVYEGAVNSLTAGASVTHYAAGVCGDSYSLSWGGLVGSGGAGAYTHVVQAL